MRDSIKLWQEVSTIQYHKAYQDLRASDTIIHPSAEEILFRVWPEDGIFDTTIVSGYDLGFQNPVRFRSIINRAKDWGLSLCPSYLGLSLPLQCREKLKSELLLIVVSAPITAPNGSRKMFGVGTQGEKPYITAVAGSPTFVQQPYQRFIFTIPAK